MAFNSLPLYIATSSSAGHLDSFSLATGPSMRVAEGPVCVQLFDEPVREARRGIEVFPFHCAEHHTLAVGRDELPVDAACRYWQWISRMLERMQLLAGRTSLEFGLGPE